MHWIQCMSLFAASTHLALAAPYFDDITDSLSYASFDTRGLQWPDIYQKRTVDHRALARRLIDITAESLLAKRASVGGSGSGQPSGQPASPRTGEKRLATSQPSGQPAAQRPPTVYSKLIPYDPTAGLPLALTQGHGHMDDMGNGAARYNYYWLNILLKKRMGPEQFSDYIAQVAKNFQHLRDHPGPNDLSAIMVATKDIPGLAKNIVDDYEVAIFFHSNIRLKEAGKGTGPVKSQLHLWLEEQITPASAQANVKDKSARQGTHGEMAALDSLVALSETLLDEYWPTLDGKLRKFPPGSLVASFNLVHGETAAQLSCNKASHGDAAKMEMMGLTDVHKGMSNLGVAGAAGTRAALHDGIDNVEAHKPAVAGAKYAALTPQQKKDTKAEVKKTNEVKKNAPPSVGRQAGGGPGNPAVRITGDPPKPPSPTKRDLLHRLLVRAIQDERLNGNHWKRDEYELDLLSLLLD